MIFEWHKRDFEQLMAGRAALPHAILLRGSQGIGKAEFARALSQALLCEKLQPPGLACLACAACHWFGAGTHPDFRQVEPEILSERKEEDGSDRKPSLQISIDQIRVLSDFVNVSSHRGGPKVILVHPAEALNVNAANALLKSLEEPPPRTYFVLVSHRPHLLLPTVRSRCRQITLRGPDPETAAKWLKSQGVSDPELGLAQTANSPLLALQLDDEYWHLRDSLLSGLASTEFNPLALAEELRDRPIQHVVGCLQRWTYDLVSQKLLGTVRYNPDRKTALAAAAARVDELAALRFHREMVRTQRIVNHPLNARLFIEQLLCSYAELLQPAGTGA